MYDYLIVGSGLFGSVCARELTDLGKKVMVIDSRSHIGGNCYTENKDGINIHKYGCHIFHTSSKKIWDYVNQFAEFNHFTYRPKVNYNGSIYSFPLNLLTLYQLYGVSTPSEAIKLLSNKKKHFNKISNLEEYALSEVGEEIYNIFIKDYTYKQWKTEPSSLPSSILKRIPIRTNFDDNYFDDIYQGIPIGGYTQIFEKLLCGIEVRTSTNYFENREYFDSISNKIIFTGRIDEFYNYKHGELNYRTLDFETKMYETKDFQGVAVINYTSLNVPHTRTIEHKHFEFGKQPITYLTTETPTEWGNKKIPFYPINNNENNAVFNKYKNIENSKVIFGGRLGSYKYYDMHQVIAEAINTVKKISCD